MEIFLLFLLSLFSSFFLVLVFKFIFYKYKFLDKPEKYGYKRKPIPYSMGIIFFLNFIGLSYFFVDHSYKIFLMFLFGFIITFISFFDDFFDINPKIRLFFQIIVGLTIGLTSIKIGYISNIFGGSIDLQTHFFDLYNYRIYYIPLLFTVFWYVLIFNALNWSDGIPGLTSGLSFVSFFIIFLLGVKLYLTDDYAGGIQNAEFIMKICIILLGSILVFWCFDVTKKMLMGDSGTMFLGFMLATLAIVSGGKIATVVVVFGVYLIDAFYVIFKRLINKKSPLKKDLTHFHHRLKQAGLTDKQILTLIYSLSFFFGIASLFLDKIGKIVVFLILVFIVIFLNIITMKLRVKK